MWCPMTRTTDEYGRPWAVDGSEHDPRRARAARQGDALFLLDMGERLANRWSGGEMPPEVAEAIQSLRRAQERLER